MSDILDPKSLGFTRTNLQSEDRRSFNLIDKRSLQIAKSGTLIISSGTNPRSGIDSATGVVIHNLGYTPAFLAYFTNGNITPATYTLIPDSVPVFFNHQGQTQAGGNVNINARADNVNLYFDLEAYWPIFDSPARLGYPYVIKYYIYALPLS